MINVNLIPIKLPAATASLLPKTVIICANDDKSSFALKKG